MTATRLPGGEEMKYTEKIHAKRLLGMLEKKNPCSYCPAGKDFKARDFSEWGLVEYECGDINDSYVAGICVRFVGGKDCCPCTEFGRQEAIKRTWLALEEKGYLD